MIRLLAAVTALVLFAIPCRTAPVRPVVVVGAAALLLAAAGIVGLWRWPATAAGCLFLTAYAGALWVARAPVNVMGAVAFGLALLLLLASIELGRGARRATVDVRAARSQLAAWLGFAVTTLACTLIGLAVARGLVASIPFAAAPFVAALAALGVVAALAALLTGRRAA
jgi:hypothetical protein